MVLLAHSVQSRVKYVVVLLPRFHDLTVCLVPLAPVKMHTPREKPQAILAMFISLVLGILCSKPFPSIKPDMLKV